MIGTANSQREMGRLIRNSMPVEEGNEDRAKWFALYVKPRHEFSVHDSLAKNGVQVFLPSVTRLRQWKDRKKWVEFPLFPGYIFVHVLPLPEQFMVLLKTCGVLRILSSVPGEPTPVPEAEISSLMILLKSDQQFDLHPELQPGKSVRIKAGLLEGVQGVISKKAGRMRLSVNLTMLGRSLSVQMSPEDVELA